MLTRSWLPGVPARGRRERATRASVNRTCGWWPWLNTAPGAPLLPTAREVPPEGRTPEPGPGLMQEAGAMRTRVIWPRHLGVLLVSALPAGGRTKPGVEMTGLSRSLSTKTPVLGCLQREETPAGEELPDYRV